MKKLLSIAIILCFVVPVLAFAQDKMTEEQAQAEIARIRAELEQLNADIATLEGEVDALQTSVSKLETLHAGLTDKVAELREAWKRCTWGRYRYSVRR